MKTVMPLPSGHFAKLIRIRTISASARIRPLDLPGEVVAFGEHLVDGVNRLPVVPWRSTRPDRRLELWTWHVLPPDPPTGKTPGLARQIIERQLEGLEPAAEAFGTHKAIGGRNGTCFGRACLPRGYCPVASEEMDARGIAHGPSMAAAREVFPRIEELEGGMGRTALPALG